MQPWFRLPRKENREKPIPPPSPSGQFKLPTREALLLVLAQYAALTDGALLYAAHQAGPLIFASAVAAFVGAYHFFDGLIESELSALAGVRPPLQRAAGGKTPGSPHL